MLKEFFNNKSNLIITILIVFVWLTLFTRSCSTNTSIKQQNQKIDSMLTIINSINEKSKSDEEYRKMLNDNMFNFLQYEEDIDNKKVTFSELKILLQQKK